MFNEVRSAQPVPAAYPNGAPVMMFRRVLSEPGPMAFAAFGMVIKRLAMFSDGLALSQSALAALKWTGDDAHLWNWFVNQTTWTGEGFNLCAGETVPVRLDGRFLDKAERDEFRQDTEEFTAVPSVLVDAVYCTALRSSRFFPLVDAVPFPSRGRRVRGPSIRNPVFVHGDAEPRTSVMMGRETELFTAVCAADFERFTEGAGIGDTLAIGRLAVDYVGRSMAEYLDRVIVAGDGKSEPLGVCNTEPVTRVRGLPQAVSEVHAYGNGREVVRFGPDPDPYHLQPVHIQHKDATAAGAFVPSLYRMYFRPGFALRVQAVGSAGLSLPLVTCRVHVGGQLTDEAAARIVG